MSEGFRRAGVVFDMAVDFMEDHCDSYEANLGHRPVRMDAVDLLRMVKLGWKVEIDLLVADPPCTPWSRAGKRMGTEDDRDMLEVTCSLIAALKPRRYLIGNVPGLDDAVNLHVVRKHIGGLSKHGYCTADFAKLNAAAYGVPQHRWRPFWFGHRGGPCITWPAPTHGDPLDPAVHAPLPGFGLLPWITCRVALGHLGPDDLGRPVKMSKRTARSTKHPVINGDDPSTTIRGGGEGHSAPQVLVHDIHHPPSYIDEPAMTVCAGSGGGARTAVQLSNRHDEPVHTSNMDEPARALTTQCRAPGHASTIMLNEKHHPATMDARAPTVGAKSRGRSSEVLLTDGQPPPKKKRNPSTQGHQSERVTSPDKPAATVQAREDRAGSGSPVLEWPWTRPATTVTSRPGLAPPGHHDEEFAIMSLPDAIILSEQAARILQGFPEDWVFVGETKKARWSQLGQAMPIQLAQAVATSVVRQDVAAPAPRRPLCSRQVFVDDGFPYAQCRYEDGHANHCAPLECP